MVCKVDLQTYTSEFKSYWVPHSYMALCHVYAKSLVNDYFILWGVTEAGLANLRISLVAPFISLNATFKQKA